MNGLEEGEDAMTDEEGEGFDGEGETRAADWRVKAGPRNKLTARERNEHEATHLPFRDWCAQCMMGRGRTHQTRIEAKERKFVQEIHIYFSYQVPLPALRTIECHAESCSQEEHREDSPILPWLVKHAGASCPGAKRGEMVGRLSKHCMERNLHKSLYHS